jgi:ATP-dependent helicase HrpA
LPAQIVVTEHHGVPVLAYPGLKAMPTGVAVRLSATPEEAAAMTREGLRKLFETQLRYDLGWLEKDLKALRMLGTLAVTLVTPDDLQKQALESIRHWVTDPLRLMGPLSGKTPGQASDPAIYLKAAKFATALEEAKRDLRGIVPKLGDWLKEIFTLRLALETNKQPYPGMADDLAALLPSDFVRRAPFGRVQHFPRYLRGMQVRAEKWKRDSARDAVRAKELAPFVGVLRKFSNPAKPVSDQKNTSRENGPLVEAREEFRWLVEEFRVSLFAQELGTAEPVSVVRLQKALEEIGGTGMAAALISEPASHLKPSTAVKKGAPLKSLSSLDQLFRK